MVLLAQASAGCSDEETATTSAPIATGSYIGQVDGSDAKLGVVVGPSQVVAFVCGGDATYGTSTVWFRTARSAPSAVDVTSKAHELHLEKVDGSTLSGQFVLGDGSPAHTVRVTRLNDENGIAGVYEATDADGHSGVIVSSADEAQGAFIPSIAAKFLQIVPIRPLALIDGSLLRVLVAARTIEVKRIVAQ